MRIAVYLVLLIITIAGFTLGIQYSSEAGEGMNKEAVKEIVRETIQEEPKLIVDAIKAWQEQEQASQAKQQKEKAAGMADKLNNETLIPVVGNPEGSVLVAEFFDYNCPYCKNSFVSIDSIIKDDKDVKVVLMEMPIFGEDSIKISSIALAIHEIAPEKYYDYHKALMTSKGRITPQQALDIATSMGVDGDKIKEVAEGDAVTKALSAVRTYATELGVNGTPAFIVGTEFVGGAMTYDHLKEMVAAAK